MQLKIMQYDIKKYFEQLLFLWIFQVLGLSIIYQGYYENLYSLFAAGEQRWKENIATCLFKYNLDVTIVVMGIACYILNGYGLLFKSKKKEYMVYIECGLSKNEIIFRFWAETIIFFVCTVLISTLLYVSSCIFTDRYCVILPVIFVLIYGGFIELCVVLGAWQSFSNFSTK